MRRVCKEVCGILYILVITSQFCGAQETPNSQFEQENRLGGYRRWLSLTQRVQPFTDILSPDNNGERGERPGIALPDDVLIVTDSELEHCNPEKTYCTEVNDNFGYEFSSSTMFPEGIGSGNSEWDLDLACPRGTTETRCRYPECNYEPNKPMGDYLLTNIEPRVGVRVNSNDTGVLAVSRPDCGFNLENSWNLIFSDLDQETCLNTGNGLQRVIANTIDQKEVFYKVNSSQYNQVSFTLQPDPQLRNSNMSTVFFSSQYAASDDSSFQLILFNGNMQLVSNSEGFDSQMLQTPGYPQELGDYNITIQYGPNRKLVYINGELVELITDWSGSSFGEQWVSFGSEEFYGATRNIRIYNNVSTLSELYAEQHGVKVLKPYRIPECECPRPYIDTFQVYIDQLDPPSLRRRRNAESNSGLYCSNILDYQQPQVPRYDTQWYSLQDKFALFSSVGTGWTSDHTTQADITLQLPQDMLIYGVYGTLDKLPSRLELQIGDGAMVTLTHDCSFLDMERDTLPQFSSIFDGGYFRPESGLRLPQRKKRSSQNVSKQRRCFQWEDVTAPSFREEVEDINGQSSASDFVAPLLLPFDEAYSLSNVYAGKMITIRLRGHTNVLSPLEEWYGLGGLEILGRPHCGGNFNSPTRISVQDMTDYYEFFSPDTQHYTCFCPAGIEGERCQSCGLNNADNSENEEELYRYQESEGVCVDCGCTSLSEGLQCDSSGQCPCRDINGEDIELAGRQCNWYIDDIFPLFGPVAGGTVVTMTGGYLTEGTLSASLNGEELQIISQGNYASFRTDQFPKNDTTDVDLTLSLSQEIVFQQGVAKRQITSPFQNTVGPGTIYLPFQYRPNPVIRDIQPRSTFLNGGLRITIIGENMDSTATPEMVIYLRQNGAIIQNYTTMCTPVDDTSMTCPTPDVRETTEDILLGSDPGPAATTTIWTTTRNTTTTTRNTTTTTTTTSPTTEDFTDEDNISGSSSTSSQPTPPGGLPPSATTETPLLARRRKKRQASANGDPLNGRNGLGYTFGFRYDGYVDYEDLTKHPNSDIRDIAELKVFPDPKVTTFLEDIGDEVLEYHPKEDEFIRLKGEGLDWDKDQWQIEIGLGVCEVTSVLSNQIVCKPPTEAPEVDREAGLFKTHKRKDSPPMTVRIGKLNSAVGYVYYRTSPWDDPSFRAGMIVLIVLVVIAILAVIAYFLLRKRMRARSSQKELDIALTEPSSRYVKAGGEAGAITPFLGRKLDEELRAKVDRCLVPKERLSLGKQLGKGNFGLVYKGQLTTPAGNLRTVAVKSIKEDKEVSFEDLENFLTEGVLMIDFKHENVLSLIGVVYEEGDRPLVVLPFMENGDLCTFIKRDEVDLVLADLLHFGYQMANGMAYLAKERFVHRDLAARNCMIDGSYMVKIADFGMSRDVYEKDYYTMDNMNKPLPMKWMAVESLREGRFTSKSDVWSYGVTMWELLTRGSSPYPGVNNYYIREYVVTGKRLDKPEICPPIIYEMMCRCWEENPDNRPSFAEISQFILMLLNGQTKPAAGSTEQDGYSYCREATKHIPEDYLTNTSVNVYDDYITAEPVGESYLTAQPSVKAPSAPKSTVPNDYLTAKPSVKAPSAPSVAEEQPEYEVVLDPEEGGSAPTPAKRTNIPCNDNDYMNTGAENIA